MDFERQYENVEKQRTWTDEVTGYRCMLIQIPEMLHYCGYVEVKEGSAAYDKRYDDDLFQDIKVHGGITFAGVMEPFEFALGFDCAHAGDLVPGILPDLLGTNGIFRDAEFVAHECASLARQLVAIEIEADHTEPDQA